jgi:hypothetical protein
MSDGTNSTSGTAELKATFDPSGVKGGLEQAGDALKEFANKAKKEGEEARKGLEKPGEQSEKTAAKIERETRSIIGSIERATAAAKAGERGTASYFEALGKQRGISADALKPYVEDLRRAEAAQKAASAGLGTMGISAAQTAAALRQVPAQFTDIATSLAAGQAPLTVFLQQGGQLKDTFGGAGAAARALGGYVLGLVNPFTIAAAAAGAALLAYNQGANEAQAYARALILSGNAAGTTAAQLQGLAAAQSKVVGTQSQAADALAQLAATGRVAAGQLSLTAEAAVRFARSGGDVGEVVKKFADLGKDPLKALIQLNESENFLTESVYRQIKALTEQGRLAEAAKVAQAEYARVTIGRAKDLEGSLGTLERSWRRLGDFAKGAWAKMLNLGREDTAQQKLAAVEDQIREQEALLQAARSRGVSISKTALVGVGAGGPQPFTQVQVESDAAEIRARIDALRAEADAHREVIRLATSSADARRVAAAAIKGTIKADEEAATAKSKVNAEMEREAAALERAIGLSGSYYKDLAELVKLRQRSKLTEEQYVAQVGKLINAQPIVREHLQAESEARQQAKKLLDEQAKAYERSLEAQLRSVERVDEQIQKLKDENDALLLSASSNISLAAAVEMLTAARLTEQRVKADAAGDYLTAAALQAEIDKRKELAGLINTKDAREAAKKSADEAAREWQRSANEIERSITDALMRGFESGKGFAQTLRDTLVNTFKTMVLRPVIQAIVSPVAGALAGGLGFAGAASANTGAGSLSGLLGGSGWFTDFGASVSDLVGSLGIKAFDAGFQQIGTALMANNMSIGSMANTLGSGLGYLSAINNLRQGNYGAGVLGGAGTLAFGPVGGLLGNTIGGLLDKAFGGAGTHHAGAGYVSDGMAGMSVNNGGYGLGWSYGDSVGKYFSPDVETALKTITASSASLLNSLSKSFGGAGGYQVGAYFASDNNRESQGGRSVLLNGQTLSEWNGRGLAADAKAGLEQLTGELAGQVRAAMGQIDLPTWARDQLAALSSSATLDDLGKVVTEINNTKLAITALGAAFPPLATLSDEAVSGLLKAAGGVQALGQSAAVYFDNFYTDAEKSARATSQLSDALQSLGLSLPTTREAYRAMVEAQDLSTESGQKAYAALLQMSGAFAQLVPATEVLASSATTAADAVDRAAEQMIEAGRRALADLASQRGSLEVELLRAQGDITGALARQREQDLARITGGLSAQDAAAAVAAYDLNAALQAQIDQTYAAANAAKTAAQAELDRAAAAERAAAEVAAAELQRIKAIASERDSLEVAILRATGNTAELRARELAALDASNRPLQERLYLLADQADAERIAQQQATDLARAAEEQARAAADAANEQARALQQLRDAWQGVTDSIYDEVARLRQLATGGSPQTLAAAQANFSIGLAQSRSGDQEAARNLPALSQALLAVAERQVADFGELQRLRLRLAAQLESVGQQVALQYGLSIPRLDTGTNRVPADMLAVIHRGEAVVPAPFNPANGGGGFGSADVVAAINGLRAEQKAQALAIVNVQRDVAKVLKAWNADGMPDTRVEVTT